MNGRYLLDTNIVIALFAREASVIARFEAAGELFVPCIVLGELYYGARNSMQVTTNLARIGAFQAASAVLVCNASTAASYGEVKAELKQKGTPIPENDIWIAATARQHGLTLVSRDKHFELLSTLKIESW